MGYLSAETFRYIIFLYCGCGRHLERVRALKEHSFVAAVWSHCCVYQDTAELWDVHKRLPIPELLVVLVPVHLTAHQKKRSLVQL